MSLELQPISFPEACQLIALWHRHHLPPQGWKFGLACNADGVICGVVTVGRPVARHLDNGWTLEVTRHCIDPVRSQLEAETRAAKQKIPNAASFLYAAAWRATRALDYKRLITYTLETEAGKSLRAAGWRDVGKTDGHSWNMPSRPRVDKHPLGIKTLWEASE